MGDTRIVDDLLSAWLESEPGPAAVVDPEGRYVGLNAPLRHLLLWSIGDRLPVDRVAILDARLAGRWVSPDDEPEPFARLAEPTAEVVDLTLTDALDGETWVYESRPLLNTAGRVVGWRDRFVPLADGAPETLRHQLRDALRRKDEYLAGVGHELRTPLTAILGFCHLLLSYGESLTETQRLQVRKIQKNASIQMQLLHNVLDLAKLNSGTARVNHQEVDLQAIVREAFEFVEPQAFEKALELRQELPPLPPLTTDRQKLRQILVNLLGNAVKYTDRGAVTVTGAAVDDGVYLQVRDTGRGIPPEQQDRIFEAFVRMPEDEAGATSGTGLGLNICARLTRLLGGAMTVDSVVGEGSTFTLKLPLAPDSRRG